MIFSVIMPAYNVDQYIAESIESVICQNFHDIELIIVNDGSTDNTGSIIKNFAEQDKRIVLVEQRNKGLSAARNSGLRIAKGQYIVFLDSDDVLAPDVLTSIYDIIVANDYPEILIGNMLNWCNTRLYCENPFDENIIEKNNFLESIVDFVNNYNWIPWAAYQSIYSSKFIFDNNLFYDESIIGAEDCEFFLRIAKYCKKYVYKNISFVHYRINREGSIITNPKKNAVKGQLEVFKKGFDFAVEIDNSSLKKFFASRYANIIVLLGCLKKKEANDLKKYISNNEYIIANVDNTPKYNAAKLLWSVFGYYHGSRILIKLKRIIT